MADPATRHSSSTQGPDAPSAPPSRVQPAPTFDALLKGFDARVVAQVRENYVRPDASSGSRGLGEPLFKSTDKFLAASDEASCLLVVAGPGQGKSSYVVNYLAWHQDKRRTPILAVALAHPRAAEFIAKVGDAERKKCVLLLDGLEDYPSSSRQSTQRLDKVLELARGFRRIVVTARDDPFPDPEPTESEKDETEPVGPLPAGVRRLFLLPLNARQLSRYLKQRYSLWRIGRRRAARRLVQTVPFVMNTPLLVAHSDELLAAKRMRTIADGLEAITEAWLFREKAALKREVLLHFAQRLAMLAYKKVCQGRRARISADEVLSLARELGHDPPELGAYRPILLSDEDGSVTFAHAAILEYLYVSRFLELTPERRLEWLGTDEPSWTPLIRTIVIERFVRPGAQLSYADLRGADLSGVDLSEANLQGARLAGAKLASANLGASDLTGADCEGVLLTAADLQRANLTSAKLGGADLSEADLSEATLDLSDLRGAVLAEATLHGASFGSAKLDGRASRSLAPSALDWQGDTAIEPITGVRLVWIPGGTFTMGHDGDPPESSPAHRVRVSSLWLSETSVTNRQYGKFLEQTGHPEPEFWKDPRFSDPDQPAVGVRFEDALAFCRWLEQESGLHFGLPTEAEWEYGARGSDGRRYPWGNDPPSAERACYEEDAMEGRPAKVGSYPSGRGPHGTLDQAGNVWEWCLDTWDPMAYLKRSRELALDPVVEDGQVGVQLVRGGSWFFPPEDLDATARGKNQRDKSADDLGFRVALRLTPAYSAQAESELMKLSAPPT